MKITTIKLQKKTKDRLDRLKSHKRDSYDEVLQKLLGILNTCRINPERARARLIKIARNNRKLTRKKPRSQSKPVRRP